MRGTQNFQGAMFSYISLEERVPAKHPLRKLRSLVDALLASMSAEFEAVYARRGRPSVPPEMLLKALLLQILFSIRSERLLVEAIDYNLLYRWFVGLNIEDKVWDHSTFSANRERLFNEDLARAFFERVKLSAQWGRLASDEHFSVDGTLIQAWASHKSMRRKDGSDDDRPPEDWKGQPRSNDTHESTSDPDSRLYRKSHAAPALPSYLGHVLTDNRHGLVVNVQASTSDGTAERDIAAQMLAGVAAPGKRVTVGADKAYDTKGFVRACREINVTPHVAQNVNRIGGSAIDSRTTRHVGYEISQRKRKCIEQCFGWGKVIGPIRQVMVQGLDRVDQLLTLTMAAYNLTRLRTLAQLRPQCAP